MGALQKFEQRLERAISGAFAKAFRSAVQPVEIAAALQREVDNNSQILSRDRRLAPNDFHVELSGADMARLAPYDSAMERELSDQLHDHATKQAYVFPGPVTIVFEEADDLSTGRFRVTSKAMASVRGSARRTRIRETRAYLDINGTSHPLTPPGLTVGRGLDSDVRINDPGISRQHVEFNVSMGRTEDGSPLSISVRDLGSTNGMLVDGHRATAVRLRNGSRVRIGSTDMILRVVEDDRIEESPGEDSDV
ncbi:MAG: DUF3662 and FHA domain-containing protein [Nocardioides sp.]|uniref:FhaA domain-containing protein n=1 Tax=Nocardioides sp. TaxID=35761 RepID=UPI0039E39220